MRIPLELREGHFTATGIIVYAPASEIINDVIFLDCSVQYVLRGRVEELIYNNRRFNNGKKCTIYWEVPRFTTTVTEDTFKKLRSFKSAEDVLLTRKLLLVDSGIRHFAIFSLKRELI
jgi:hypothetical protein